MHHRTRRILYAIATAGFAAVAVLIGSAGVASAEDSAYPFDCESSTTASAHGIRDRDMTMRCTSTDNENEYFQATFVGYGEHVYIEDYVSDGMTAMAYLTLEKRDGTEPETQYYADTDTSKKEWNLDWPEDRHATLLACSGPPGNLDRYCDTVPIDDGLT